MFSCLDFISLFQQEMLMNGQTGKRFICYFCTVILLTWFSKRSIGLECNERRIASVSDLPCGMVSECECLVCRAKES